MNKDSTKLTTAKKLEIITSLKDLVEFVLDHCTSEEEQAEAKAIFKDKFAELF